MATRKHTTGRRLFLKEHREAKGLSASEMGEKLGIERESVYRLEKKYLGVSSQKQAEYARALGIEPEELWRPPDNPSLDAIMSRAPEDVRASVHNLIRRLVPDMK
jgi:transcriptional regulator with XRE-family HTH domain